MTPLRILTASAAASFLASTAIAGGLAEPVAAPVPVAVAPAPVMAPSWDGFYAGLAYGTGEFDYDDATYDTDVYGGQVGYLRDLGNVVVGGELQYVVQSPDVAGANLDDGSTTRIKGILGYDGGRVMPFVSAGVANVDSAFGDSGSGYTYGVGAEVKVTERIRAGVEYVADEVDDLGGAAYSNSEILLRVNFQF